MGGVSPDGLYLPWPAVSFLLALVGLIWRQSKAHTTAITNVREEFKRIMMGVQERLVVLETQKAAMKETSERQYIEILARFKDISIIINQIHEDVHKKWKNQ